MADNARTPRRPPPAYQEYPTDLLANETVREMSLEELGLFAALRWSCWANNDVPREPERLSRLLGKDLAEVQRAMTEAVMSFFEPTARTPSRLHAPELTNQRKRMFEKSAERSKSGRKGARSRWEKEKRVDPGNGSANGSLSRTQLIRERSLAPEDDIPF